MVVLGIGLYNFFSLATCESIEFDTSLSHVGVCGINPNNYNHSGHNDRFANNWTHKHVNKFTQMIMFPPVAPLIIK